MTRRLRVAVLYPSPVGYRTELFKQLAQREDVLVTVLFCGSDGTGRARDPFTADQSMFRHIFLRGVLLGSKTRGLPFYLNPGIGAWLKQYNPDVVVISGYAYPTAIMAIAAARRGRIPIVLLSSSHHLSGTFRSGVLGAVRSIVFRWAVNQSGALLVLGTPQAEEVLKHGASPTDVFLLGQPFAVEEWQSAPERLRPRGIVIRRRFGIADGPIVTTAGRLVREKSIEDLIAGFAMFLMSRPEWNLVIAGDGPERPALESEARRRAPGKVLFLGALNAEEMRELFAITEIFVLPSSRETWGTVLSEAMASGVPVVATDRVGATRDLLQSTGAGYVIPARDPTAIAEALSSLAENEGLRATLARKGQMAVTTHSAHEAAAVFVAACKHSMSLGTKS